MISDREQRLANALADFIDRQAREGTIDIQSFCALHPDLAADLRAQLEALTEIDRVCEPAPAGAEIPPERLSGLKILGELGSGGMGRVFLAFDERLDRKVAIKTLSARYRDNPQVCARFMQEARAMARVNHPHIVRIYDLGPADEPPHFVMEYVEGVSLTEAARPLTLRQKAELMHKVALAADFLHQHQIIHRDLKPGNILAGADLEPKILDFGLALQVDEAEDRLTRFGEVIGTPRYFSPEQTWPNTPLDARSDVFSLGTVLYELLTGTPPFRADSIPEQIRAIREQDPVLPRRLNRGVPGELQNIWPPLARLSPARGR